jgi:hypothetical protein
MKRRLLQVGLGLTLVAAPASAQTLPQLEHFDCYAVLRADPQVNVKVRLADQFNTATTAPTDVEVVRPVRFCNPVGKFHRGQFTPVVDDRQHLTFYITFPQDDPLRIVTLSNQFNPVGAAQQVWRVGDGIILAVPTQKPPHNRPEGLDHYRCYIAHGNPVNEIVGLIDQFLPGHLRAVLDPILFCNPVRKTRLDTNEVTPILNPNQHMACYTTTRMPFQGSRDLLNQFGPQTMAFGRSDILCVPTRKIGFQTIPDNPFGTPGTSER